MDAIEKESLLLYDLCCAIGISSNQRKRNIQFADCWTTLGNIHCISNFKDAIIICGSKSEGIRLFPTISSCLGTSSDIDVMCICDGINVQEHVYTTNTNKANVLQLLYTDSPEHVLLEVKSYERACKTSISRLQHLILKVIKIRDNKYLVSSSLLNRCIQRSIVDGATRCQSILGAYLTTLRHATFQVTCTPDFKNATIHGPAVMTDESPYSYSADRVVCLRCYEWPTAAHEWIDRARPHDWPSQDLIDQIMYDGCELVPVGRKDHPDEDVQWKLSFTRAETRLIRSFNIYQAQCYQLLKIVKSCFISTVEADSLSSYHIKTVMLHTVEQTHPEFWRKENLSQCFAMCLSKLKWYLKDKFLPQYFIVEQNLLEPKVTGDVHQKVLEIVTDLDKIGWKCVLQCPVLQTLCRSIQEPVYRIPYNYRTCILELEGNIVQICEFCSRILFKKRDFLFAKEAYHYYLIRIVVFCEKTFLKPTAIHPSVETVRVLQLLQKSEIGLLLTVIRAMADPDLRPGIEPMMNFARQCLEESCHADVSSCRLKFATFFFHLGEYDRCISTVQDVLERFKDVWAVVGGFYTRRRDTIIELLENIDTSKLELNRVLQLSENGLPFISEHVSLPAIFIRWEVAVAPKGIHFLNRKMPRRKRLISEACCIDSIVYAHYLLLESYLRIDKYDLAEHALINMKVSIRNGKDDMFDRNCLCYCEEDNLLLQYSNRLMKVAKNVKDK